MPTSPKVVGGAVLLSTPVGYRRQGNCEGFQKVVQSRKRSGRRLQRLQPQGSLRRPHQSPKQTESERRPRSLSSLLPP